MDKGPAKLFRSTNESLGDAPDIFFPRRSASNLSAVAAQPRTAGSSIRTLLDRKAAKFGKDISPNGEASIAPTKTFLHDQDPLRTFGRSVGSQLFALSHAAPSQSARL